MKTLKITLSAIFAMALFTSFSNKNNAVSLSEDLIQNEMTTNTISFKNGVIDMTMTVED